MAHDGQDGRMTKVVLPDLLALTGAAAAQVFLARLQDRQINHQADRLSTSRTEGS